MSNINIAIDGPSGAGKSSVAKKVSVDMGYIYVDTGAMYRAVGLFRVKNNLEKDEDLIKSLDECNIELKYVDNTQRIYLNGIDVSDEIRQNHISMIASKTSAIPEVREFLFGLQQNMARENNVIMDGRDIGTVVLPNADVKIYLTATVKERADRRFKELSEKQECPSYETIYNDIVDRDYNDMNREIAPLKKADDAVEIDSTNLSFDEVVDKIKNIIFIKQ